MFVRKKKNPSGMVSVQIIDKSSGRYKMVKTIGSSSDSDQILKLVEEGHQWIQHYEGQTDLFSLFEKEQSANRELEETERVLGNIDNILINGTELILDYVFKGVGFDKINDNILKQLVITRLCQPSSKSGTVDYLKSYFDEDLNLSKIYRYLGSAVKPHRSLSESSPYFRSAAFLFPNIRLLC
jgi:hypothetical protein